MEGMDSNLFCVGADIFTQLHSNGDPAEREFNSGPVVYKAIRNIDPLSGREVGK